MDPSHWELKSSPARAGLHLALGLSSLATARHLAIDLKRSEKVHGLKYRSEKCTMKLQRQKQNHLQELLGAGIFGHSLGALGHCMLGQLSRQQEANSSLDLTGGDGGPVERQQIKTTGGDKKKKTVK